MDTQNFSELTQNFSELTQNFSDIPESATEPQKPKQKVITLRLPSNIHVALKNKAYENKMSLNKFCLVKLMECFTEQENHDTLNQTTSEFLLINRQAERKST